MQSGKMRWRLEIQAQADLKAPWLTEAVRWGSVEPLSGRELYAARQVQAEVTHRVRLRYYPAISSHKRFKVGERTFNITEVMNPDERKRETSCLCVEQAS